MKKQSGKGKMKREMVIPDPVVEATTSTNVDPDINVKALPVEVLKNVLDRLTDKHTLAQCMRVSSTFNSIVAPLLYRSISIDGKTKPFFASPRMSEAFKKTRKTQTKSMNLEYVEEVVYTLHQKRGCTPTSRAKTWDSLSMRPRTLRIVNPPHEFGIENPACGCFDKITPLKMVLPKRIYFWAFRSLDICTQMNTTVVAEFGNWVRDPSSKRGPPLIGCVPWIWRVKEPNPNRAAFIFHSNPGQGNDFILMEFWYCLRNSYFEEARYVGTPGDFLFVNVECTAARGSDVADREGKSDTDVANDGVRKAYLLHLSRPATRHPDVLRKTEEQARQVTFKFVTMKTYLTEYDWRGELTEDQARPWLDLLEDEKVAEAQMDEEEEAMNA